MLKFWRSNANRRVRELSEIFSTWANNLDHELTLVANGLMDYDTSELIEKCELFSGSLGEILMDYKEYSGYFTQKVSNSDYARARDRLQCLLGMIRKEAKRRGSYV